MKNVTTFSNYVVTKVQDNQEKFVAIIKSLSQQRANCPKAQLQNFVTTHNYITTFKVKKVEKVVATQLRQKREKNVMTFRNFVVPKDKENGNRTLSRHPKLDRDKECKELLERMPQHKNMIVTTKQKEEDWKYVMTVIPLVATKASKSSRTIVATKFAMPRPTIQRLTMQGMEIMSRHQKLMMQKL